MIIFKNKFTLNTDTKTITVRYKISAIDLYSELKSIWIHNRNITPIGFPLKETIGNITDGTQQNHFNLQNGWSIDPIENVETAFVKTAWAVRGNDPAG